MNLINKFAPYPKAEVEATAETVYRYLLVSAQVSHLRWQAMERPAFDTPPTDPAYRKAMDAYMAGAELFVSHWSTLHLMRHVMGLPSVRWTPRDRSVTADDIAQDMWIGWEDGGGPAEVLWDWLVEAGIDPEEIGRDFERVTEAGP